jgi:hypothetical protein
MKLRLIGGLGIILAASAFAQVPAARELTPNLVGNIERPLRYRPEGDDFVITNGGEFFNRPLYGGNTAFRVDAGDMPEFALYLPGRGGNLRLGLRTVGGAKWLHEAETIEARYRPGEMLYAIRDPLLGGRELRVVAVALPSREGLSVQVTLNAGPGPGLPGIVELIVAYGGASGQRGRRDGDIGTENVPISEWFQLKPEACRDNQVTLDNTAFTLTSPAGVLRGALPAGAMLGVGDAAAWSTAAGLLRTLPAKESPMPVVVGQLILPLDSPVYLGIERRDDLKAKELDTYREVSAAPDAATARTRPAPVADWAAEFAAAEAHFAALRKRVRIETPDPYLTAAMGALNVAADAVWDEPQQAIMHGAVAWRTKLLGWRGPYALDALGWTDRSRKHFEYWAGRQNTDPIPDQLPPPDAKANLARSEAALHSNGDLSKSHYDMNLVFIDALFRHLLWTGDVEFAKRMWPMIERHLAWERRLFRREFDVDGQKLPLYEAYAAIWASDDLQYSGGGTAHASAYNYWHNRMAARIAPLVGGDPVLYTQEANLIAEGMRKLLWVEKTGEATVRGVSTTIKFGGHFAESKDWLGRQLLHPSAALWSFYHVMDAGLVTDDELDAMAGYVKSKLPWLPAPRIGEYPGGYMIGTTNWMPYTWSLNNVVFSENMHAALGLWQADAADVAWLAAKGSILTSMFAGICPGNVGSMTYHDVYRRESQRDFADGSGTFSRALVEGLFGVRPDALKGELLVMPGWPDWWREASIAHPRFSLTFRSGKVNRYSIRPNFGRQMALRFLAPAEDDRKLRVQVNGQPVEGRIVGTGIWRRYEFAAPPAEAWEVEIERYQISTGRTLMLNPLSGFTGDELLPPFEPERPLGGIESVELTTFFNDRVTEIFQPGKYVSPRSPFVSLALPSQGIGYWAGHVNATAEIDDRGLRTAAAAGGGKITMPDGVAFATPGPGAAPNILFTSQWDHYPREAAVPLSGKARRIHLLMAGSTNAMQSRLDNGEVVMTYADGSTTRLALRNPETWWPIEQDYFVDEYQFRIDAPLPTRVDLKTGEVRVLDIATFKGRGRAVPGGAATVLMLELDPAKELKSLTVRALANDVVIGLMAATLER